jgi:hypothetical protein
MDPTTLPSLSGTIFNLLFHFLYYKKCANFESKITDGDSGSWHAQFRFRSGMSLVHGSRSRSGPGLGSGSGSRYGSLESQGKGQGKI